MRRRLAPMMALLVVRTLFLPSPSLACPARDLTLWELVQRADVIVRARVVRISADQEPKSPFDEDDSDHTTTQLEVIDVWKGDSPAEIRIDSEDNVAQIPNGETVLVFLQSGESRARNWLEFADGLVSMETLSWRSEDGNAPIPDISAWTREAVDMDAYREKIRRFADWAPGRWFETSVWGGSRLAREDLGALKDVVVRAAQLQLASGDEEDLRRDWVVYAAEKTAARSLAVDELSLLETGDLTDSQLSRLAAAFIRSPSFGAADFEMLRLLRSRLDPQIDRAAVSLVEAGLRLRPIPDWIVGLVGEVLRRYGDDFGARIGRDDRNPFGLISDDENTLPTIWEVARRELRIPQVLPAVAPVREAPPE